MLCSSFGIREIKANTKEIYAALTGKSVPFVNCCCPLRLTERVYCPDMQRQQVYSWLQVSDPFNIHHRSRDAYEPGTGE